MAWKRGFLRLWIVLSVVWIAVVVAIFNPVSHAAELLSRPAWEAAPIVSGSWERYQTDEERLAVAQSQAIASATRRMHWHQLQVSLGFGLIPPLALLLASFGAYWVVSGFRATGE